MRYTVYEAATGEIRRTLDVPGGATGSDWTGADEAMVEAADQAHGDDPALVYVAAGAVVARPASACTIDKTTITANGVDKATISGIPVGAEALVRDTNGETHYVITDGFLELLAAEAQSMRVRVSAFPARDFTVTVNAS